MKEKYFYYKLMRVDVNFNQRGVRNEEDYSFSSLRRVRATSKAHAKSVLRRKYRNVPFKVLNGLWGKFQWNKAKREEQR